MKHTADDIDIYPVGLFGDLRGLRSFLRIENRRYLPHRIRTMARNARRRSYWNGYLAEHPTRGTRAGHGWTKARALRDLNHHLAALDQSAAPDVPAEPCRCSNGYECPHRCWHCKANRAAGCEEWCHIRPFDTEEASR